MFRLILVNVPILIVLFSRPDSPRFFCSNSFSERGTAQNVGMTPFQSFLTSFLCYTSAGEYAGFALIAADVSLLEVAVMPLVVNVCYLLMRAAIGQRVSPGTNIYLYIFVMAFVTYLVRVGPIALIRKQIDHQFIRSFLYYVPYVALSVMTFPAITEATQSPASGALALAAGTAAAWMGGGLFQVALSCCGIVFLTELFVV